MFVAYLLYMHEMDYDHIMPAIGVQFKDKNAYDPDDVLLYYNLYHLKRIERKMNDGDLAATRKTCRKHCGEGGCIPYDVSVYLWWGDAMSSDPSENSRSTSALLWRAL